MHTSTNHFLKTCWICYKTNPRSLRCVQLGDMRGVMPHPIKTRWNNTRKALEQHGAGSENLPQSSACSASRSSRGTRFAAAAAGMGVERCFFTPQYSSHPYTWLQCPLCLKCQQVHMTQGTCGPEWQVIWPCTVLDGPPKACHPARESWGSGEPLVPQGQRGLASMAVGCLLRMWTRTTRAQIHSTHTLLLPNLLKFVGAIQPIWFTKSYAKSLREELTVIFGRLTWEWTIW